jgi:hypothetical protein
MEGRDLLGVLVRAGGGYLLLHAVSNVVYAFMKVIGLDKSSQYTMGDNLAWAVASVAMGLGLVWIADWFVDFAYRRKPGIRSGH